MGVICYNRSCVNNTNSTLENPSCVLKRKESALCIHSFFKDINLKSLKNCYNTVCEDNNWSGKCLTIKLREHCKYCESVPRKTKRGVKQ